VRVGSLELKNPIMTASGTAGYGDEFARYLDLSSIGAVVTKSIAAFEWAGNPAPRLHATPAGMINSVGLQGPGVEHWLRDHLPALVRHGATVVCSIWGRTVDEYRAAAELLAGAPPEVVAVEVNLSCPNLDAPDGARRMSFALDPVAAASAVAAVRERVACPVGAKLSPNAADIVAVAAAVAEAGADWVVLTNTVWGAGIDIEQRRPVLSGGVGGLSGPPLKPIALRGVLEVRRGLPGLPIVGGGGVRKGEDVVEYLMAGASAVAIGTAHFASPRVGGRVRRQLASWCRKHGVNRVADLTGAAVDGATW
jgi:dihydroorotate dehydrogenase (NAD+) catalytic subunit